MKQFLCLFFLLNISWTPKKGDHFELQYISGSEKSLWKYSIRDVSLITNQVKQEVKKMDGENSSEAIELWRDIEPTACRIDSQNREFIQVPAGTFEACSVTEVEPSFIRKTYFSSSVSAPFVKMEVIDQSTSELETFELIRVSN